MCVNTLVYKQAFPSSVHWEDKHHYQRGKGERDKGGVWASLVAQMVKNLPAIRETQVWSLGWEDPPEKGMATHSSILAWRIPWTEEPGRLQSMGSQRVGHNWAANTFTFFHGINRYKLPRHMKQKSNKHILYSTGNYSHYLAIAYNKV